MAADENMDTREERKSTEDRGLADLSITTNRHWAMLILWRGVLLYDLQYITNSGNCGNPLRVLLCVCAVFPKGRHFLSNWHWKNSSVWQNLSQDYNILYIHNIYVISIIYYTIAERYFECILLWDKTWRTTVRANVQKSIIGSIYWKLVSGEYVFYYL